MLAPVRYHRDKTKESKRTSNTNIKNDVKTIRATKESYKRKKRKLRSAHLNFVFVQPKARFSRLPTGTVEYRRKSVTPR